MYSNIVVSRRISKKKTYQQKTDKPGDDFIDLSRRQARCCCCCCCQVCSTVVVNADVNVVYC